MVGRTVASQDAPVSGKAGKTNSVRFHHPQIGLFGSGLSLYLPEDAIMATTLNPDHPLVSVSFTADTDFTVLADHCALFAEVLIESADPVQKLALCGRISTGLSLLKSKLADPIAPHLVECLTTDILPVTSPPRFNPDSTELCNYCLALTQVLAGQGFGSQTAMNLSWLLYELLDYFRTDLKAPRWLRTAEGTRFLDERTA